MRRAVFKNNLEGTSYSFFALYLDNAAHHIDDIFGDCHSKSRSLYTVCDGIFLTTARLEENGIRTEYTMKNGAITVYTDGHSIRMKTFCNEKTA